MADKHTALAAIAAAQLDLVTTLQLADAGWKRDAIAVAVANKRFHRVHRGVYKLGGAALSLEQRYLAAVLAGGRGAVLSHFAAAHLQGLLRKVAPPEITVARASAPKIPGVVPHRGRLHQLDRATHRGIPVTPVPRTLLDLAPHLPLDELARVVHEAHVLYRTTPEQVERAAQRANRRAGVPNLRAAMGTDHRLTLSVLEDGFLALLAEANLPLPQTNVLLQHARVDCHWPDHGLTVELLSFRYHATRHAFEDDVRRRRASGHLAYTYGDVFERPAAVISELTPSLTQ